MFLTDLHRIFAVLEGSDLKYPYKVFALSAEDRTLCFNFFFLNNNIHRFLVKYEENAFELHSNKTVRFPEPSFVFDDFGASIKESEVADPFTA